MLAWFDGDPVAGVVLLRHGSWAYYKFNASNRVGWNSRANDLVMWMAQVQARRWGCTGFDHGVSDLNQPGLIRYKDKFASGRGEVLIYGKGNSSTARRMVSSGLATATRLLTSEHCPEGLAERCSRSLYRMFA